MTVQCIEFGIHNADDDEYVNLFDKSKTRDEQISKMLYIFEADKLSACAYCRGLCEDSVRYNPAEQFIEAVR
jgi:hypothetical protein